MSNLSVEKKLDILIDLFTIPLKEEWTGFSSPREYTVFSYWKNLGLITEHELEKIFIDKKIVKNNIMLNYFKSIDYHFKPAYYINGDVADVGSGFGNITFWLLLSGASKVYSIGDPVRISFIKRLSCHFEKYLEENQKLILKDSFVRENDLTLAAEINPDSLKVVLLNDTLEHIIPRILPSLLKSSYNNLQPDGKFIARQQNTSSSSKMKNLYRLWEQVDNEIFSKQRAKKIKELIPGINQEEFQKLVKSTRGLDYHEFIDALEKFISEKVYPNHNTNVAPVNIEFDEWVEGNTDIPRIRGLLNEVGFRKTKVYPDLTHSKRSKYLQRIGTFAPSLFFSSGIFDETSVFIATK